MLMLPTFAMTGYIEALGKEAAAKAINDAKKSVAEQNRFGEIGKAEADGIKISVSQKQYVIRVSVLPKQMLRQWKVKTMPKLR